MIEKHILQLLKVIIENNQFLFIFKSLFKNKDNELWICKPVSLNQGKGIYLVRNPDTLKQKLESADDGQQKKFGGTKPIGRVIQKFEIHKVLK